MTTPNIFRPAIGYTVTMIGEDFLQMFVYDRNGIGKAGWLYRKDCSTEGYYSGLTPAFVWQAVAALVSAGCKSRVEKDGSLRIFVDECTDDELVNDLLG